MADSCSCLVSIKTILASMQVTLGEEHVHVFDAGILKKFAGDMRPRPRAIPTAAS